MIPLQNDFRKWIVYNPSLTSDKALYELYRSIDTITNNGNVSCSKLDETETYQIQVDGNETILLLTEENRMAMLNYLRTHFILGEHPEQWMAASENTAKGRAETESGDKPYFLDPRYADYMPQPVIQKREFVREEPSKWFYNAEPRKHVLGYALIGITLIQLVLIPSNVFHIDTMDGFAYVYGLVFFALHYYAVRNYRNYFLTGGLRYKTVWSITFWLYTIMYGITGLEVSVIDLITGDHGFGYLVGMPLLFIVIGLFVGWFFSFFIYYMNGGKVVTDPATIKPARN
ncbi:MAG TPA: hypothetical protein VGD40_14975 [Chryseosolibacter sp.]